MANFPVRSMKCVSVLPSICSDQPAGGRQMLLHGLRFIIRVRKMRGTVKLEGGSEAIAYLTAGGRASAPVVGLWLGGCGRRRFAAPAPPVECNPEGD